MQTTQNKVEERKKKENGFVIGRLDELYSSDESGSGDVIKGDNKPTYTKPKTSAVYINLL